MVDPKEDIKVGANIITAKIDEGDNIERMRWKMVPCGKGPKGGHHEGGENEPEGAIGGQA